MKYTLGSMNVAKAGLKGRIRRNCMYHTLAIATELIGSLGRFQLRLAIERIQRMRQNLAYGALFDGLHDRRPIQARR